VAQHRRRLALTIAFGLALSGCARNIAPLVAPQRSAVALTGGPNTSMVYLARTNAGVIAIDLGWWGGREAMARALRELDAKPSDVTDVFLTHGHRDHIGSWRLVRQSRFHLAEAERPHFFGAQQYGGWIPRLAGKLRSQGAPRPNDVIAHGFAGDTMFVFGADTLRAFVVPGHTTGSTVYLFRGALFLGDAATYTRWSGYGPARRGYSDDARAGARSLSALWARLPANGVRYVCTAHAHCTAMSAKLRTRLGLGKLGSDS
jgi:hydroxyacylglutathione hydrolase